MPKRKPFDEQGGCLQKAKRARELAQAEVAADGALADVVVVKKRRKRNVAEGDAGALAAAHCGSATLDSQAAWNWLQKWSWGKMSSIEVQQEAFNNYNDYQRMLYKVPLNDGWIPRSIQQLAQLGTWGGNPGNINRELKHWLGEPTFPKPMMVTVPMVTPKPKTGEAMTKDVQFPILLPHEIISHVYHNHPTLFSSLYIGESNGQETPAKLDEFWTTVEARQDPRLFEHPMKSRSHWKSTHVPLSLHGDAVPVTKVGKAGTKSMDVYSTSGLLGVGTTRALKLYTFGLFTSSEVKENRNTMAKIWAVLMWSLEAAFEGKFPRHDVHGEALHGQAGKELAGGLRFVLWSLKADLDHWAKAYGLTHYNSNDPCEFCTASRKGHWKGWHNYFGSDATWKNRYFSSVQWRQLYSIYHFLFQLPYLSCHNLEVDELHVMHLGTTMYMLGAVLYRLCFHVLAGDPEDIMHGIWTDINEFYKEHKVVTQYSNLKIGSFHEPGQFPKLKGKGAEVKDLVAPLAHVWNEKTRGSNDRSHRWISRMLEHQLIAQRILHDYRDPTFLPVQSAIDFAQAIGGIHLMWSLVANDSDTKGLNIWNTPTKLHYLHHLGEKAMFLNPRKGNTMLEETYMGVCKTLAKSCLHCTNDVNMPKAFMDKYLWALHFMFVYGERFHPDA